MNLEFEFIVDKVNHCITVKRAFAANRQLVWDAYTKSELLEQWWAPKPWKAKTKSMDFREGGSWHYCMVGPNGETHWALARYISIQAPERFTGDDAFADEAGMINTEMPQSQWAVQFSDHGMHTMVQYRITYDDLAQLEQTIAMGFKEGFTMALDGLDALLETMN